jgi:agmatinase
MRQVDALKSPRFCGVATFARLPHTKELKDVDVAFVGIPFDDAVTFRPGARFAPRTIRENSCLLRPYNPVLDVKPFEILSVADWGDIDVVPGYIEDTYTKIEEGIRMISENAFPLICGGDHSITLPVLRALAKKHGKLSLLHIDAHADCWDDYFGRKYNHGTTFRRAQEECLLDVENSLHIGMRGSVYGREDYDDVRNLGFKLIPSEECFVKGMDWIISQIKEIRGKVFFSFDIDAADPAYAPGTGTPEVGGFTPRELFSIVRGSNLDFVGFDLVEVSPPYDMSGLTAMLASNIFYEFLSVLARKKGE